jgi:hypothetical protein
VIGSHAAQDTGGEVEQTVAGQRPRDPGARVRVKAAAGAEAVGAQGGAGGVGDDDALEAELAADVGTRQSQRTVVAVVGEVRVAQEQATINADIIGVEVGDRAAVQVHLVESGVLAGDAVW